MTLSRRLYFDRFCLDTAAELVRDGDHAVTLKPKAFRVLRHLVEHAGELVTKDQLLDAVWPDVNVGDAVLKVAVAEIRDALGDDADRPRFIATVHRRGYRFVATVDSQRAVGRAGRTRPSCFVGRADVLARLDALLAGAVGGARHVVFVSGEAGIGKTALVDAFVAGATRDASVRVARGDCLEQYGPGEPYLPFLAALSRLCRQRDDDAVAILGRHAPSWLAQMPWLGAAPPSGAPTASAQRHLLLEMAEALEMLSAASPLVLVLEDLHWSDYATLDLLSLLARRDDPARLLIVGTYRPVDVVLANHPLKAVKQDLMARGRCEEVALELLNAAEVDAYLEARLAQAQPPKNLAQFVYSRTDGNPLFMATLVDMVAAAGAIDRPDRWEVVITELGVPESVRQAIEQLIERLPLASQRLLEAASIAGVEFTTSMVAAALEDDPDRVEQDAEALARSSGLLRFCGTVMLTSGCHATRYAFAHSLHQNVLYERIAPARRMRFHRRIGEHLEGVHGATSRDVAAELAVHFERARDASRTIRYREEAAAKAAHRYAYREAIHHLERALAAIGTQPTDDDRDRVELRLHMALASAVSRADGFGARAAERSYGRARLLSERLRATSDLFPALRGLAVNALTRGQLTEARELAERCLTLAERAADPMLLLRSHLLLGTTRYYLAEHAVAREQLERALDFGATVVEERRPGASESQVMCLAYLSHVLWFLGRSDESLARCEAARALAARTGHRPSIFWADHTGALLHQFRREPEAATVRAQAAIRAAEELDLTQWTAWGMLFDGWLAAERGRFDDGIAAMERGLAGYRATGAELGRVFFLTALAEARGRAGRVDEALTAVHEALTAAKERAELYYEAEAHRVHGELLLGRDRDAGERALRRALTLARAQGARALELRAATALGRELLARGHAERAREIVAPVHAAFDESADAVDVRNARQLLIDLDAPRRRRRRTERRRA